MDTRQLLYFRAVVDNGSFTHAAAALEMTQPSLSLSIRKLEKELNTQLLSRGRSGVTTTEAGDYVYDTALKVDALLAGFNAPRSAELQEEFAEEFFRRVEEIWDNHPIEIANRLIRGLYPESSMAESATTDLLHKDLPGALRRVLLECRDHLRRTLRVRAQQ